MSQLNLIIKTEYLTDIRAKSFWISTFVVPVIFLLFGLFLGVMMNESESATKLGETLSFVDDKDDMTGRQAVGMMCGMFLTLFLMMYGAQIFNKVKVEKTNRIVEVLATCVTGRTMMLAKIISVGLVGLTQLILWGALIFILFSVLLMFVPLDIPWGELLSWNLLLDVFWLLAFFIGGYIFFGSLFAAVGAMTDKNNENQEYVSVLTFVLLGSFYIGMYAVDNGTSVFATICSYLPFTAATVASVNAISQTVPVWQSVLQLLVLFIFAVGTMRFSGKLYTSSLLLKGKRFTPRDILTFLRAK